MTRLDFVLHRVAFSGLPYGEVRKIQERVAAGGQWEEACLEVASSLERLIPARCGASDSDINRWLASAYQAATLYGHDGVDGAGVDAVRDACSFSQILDLRSRARQAYARACSDSGTNIAPLEIQLGATKTQAYLRRPANYAGGVVILFNGLDSLAEVELHSFASSFLARGLATLSIDLPGNFHSSPRVAVLHVEQHIEQIVDTIFRAPELIGSRIGTFGVSFGGHLVLRALSSKRVAAGVAVSAPAWVRERELAISRFGSMFRLALCPAGADVSTVARQADVSLLPPPCGALLLVEALRDELFGAGHARSIARWFGCGMDRIAVDAEHVATSQVHRWLPQASDWLARALQH